MHRGKDATFWRAFRIESFFWLIPNKIFGDCLWYNGPSALHRIPSRVFKSDAILQAGLYVVRGKHAVSCHIVDRCSAAGHPGTGIRIDITSYGEANFNNHLDRFLFGMKLTLY